MKTADYRLVALVTLLGVLAIASTRLAAAQPQQPARKPDPLAQVHAHVEQARKAADDAKSALDSALAAVKKAEEHAKQVRKAVTDELDSAPELVAARAQFKKYDEEFSELKSPIMGKLQQQADYQAALAAKEAAKKKGAKEFSDATAKVKEMAVSAINASPAAKAAYDGRSEGETALRELVKKRSTALEQDPRITTLKADVDKAKLAVTQAQQKLASERKKLEEAQQQLRQGESKPKNPPKPAGPKRS